MTLELRLHDRWLAAEATFDARPKRERAQLALAVCAVLVTLWLLLVHQPLQSLRADEDARLVSVKAATEALRREASALAAAAPRDPVKAQLAEIARLERESAALAAQSEADGASVLPARDVVALLRELLAAQPDLRLVRVESLAPERVELTGTHAPGTPVRAIYRHAVEIELEGAYLPTLRWLGSVAALPWRLRWDALRYEVIVHPRAKIVLRLHTLGLEEAWIRA